jgi:hypothetical protein
MTRRVVLLIALMAAVVTGTVSAWAYWTTHGTGIAFATTGTLNAPTNTVAAATPGLTTVSVAWTASTGTPAPTGYVVKRIRTSDGLVAAACGTSTASPTTDTSCSDLAVADGTYGYVATAVYHSWTAVGASSSAVTVNSIRPSVTINQAIGQLDPTKVSPVTFTVSFSSSVGDFTASDVVLGGTAGGTRTVAVSGSGTSYTVTVAGLTTGTVIGSIPANVAHDVVGAGNTASTSADASILFDSTLPAAAAPVVSATTSFGANPIFVNHESISLTDTAADTNSGVKSVNYYLCTGLSGSCTSLNGTLLGTSSVVGTFSLSSSALTGVADGPFRVVANAVDNAGNLSADSAVSLVTVDTTPPTVSRPIVNGNS